MMASDYRPIKERNYDDFHQSRASSRKSFKTLEGRGQFGMGKSKMDFEHIHHGIMGVVQNSTCDRLMVSGR